MKPIEQLCRDVLEADEKATPGPWFSDGRELDQHKPYPDTGSVAFYPDCHTVISCDDCRPVSHNADMEFIALTRTAAPLLAREVLRLSKLVNDCLPIVEEAYWDQHTAGIFSGAGYNHKAQCLAGQKWGWQDSSKFESWKKAALNLKDEK